MAIFLLFYIILLAVWGGWSALLTYVFFKYRYPDENCLTKVIVFWIVSAVIIIVSVVFIALADWHTVPDIMKSIG